MRAAADTFVTYDIDWWTGMTIIVGSALAGRLVGKHLVEHARWFWTSRKPS